MIQVKLLNISFQYSEFSPFIFEKFSFDIDFNESIAIIGSSGSGKTTLLKILAGLEKPTSGQMKMNYKTYGNFVFQSPVLMDWLNVENNILFPGVYINNNDSMLEELLDVFELHKTRKYHPRELSGGMKSRVQLARALYKKPKILFLDEAFSALDERLRMQLNLLTKSLRQRYNFSMVMVSHSIEEAVFMANRVLILQTGHSGFPAQIEEIPLSQDYSSCDIKILDSDVFRSDVSKLRSKIMLRTK